NQVVWLHPGEKGAFTPESLPEDSFRPLWDWIDYVLDHEKEPLAAWVQATQFDFEPFICEEDPTTKPKRPPSDSPKQSSSRASRSGKSDQGGQMDTFAPVVQEEGADTAAALEELVVVKAEPSAVQKQLRELEERFLSFDGGLDTSERQEMW